MSDEGTQKQKRIIAITKLAFLVLIIVGVPAFIYVRFGSEVFSRYFANDIIAYLNAHRSTALLTLLLLQALQVVVCILPGQPIQFASSYMFGVIPALFISLAGAMIGVVISFYISRLLGRDAMHVLFGEEKIGYYREKLNSAKGILIVFLIYLIPGIPKDLTSYAAGVSEMRFIPFLVVSTIGRIPGMMGSILFAYFFKRGNYTALVLLSVIALIIAAVCIYKRNDVMDLLDRLSKKSEEIEGE